MHWEALTHRLPSFVLFTQNLGFPLPFCSFPLLLHTSNQQHSYLSSSSPPSLVPPPEAWHPPGPQQALLSHPPLSDLISTQTILSQNQRNPKWPDLYGRECDNSSQNCIWLYLSTQPSPCQEFIQKMCMHKTEIIRHSIICDRKLLKITQNLIPRRQVRGIILCSIDFRNVFYFQKIKLS